MILEVLVATRNQNNMALYKNMNIQSDLIIANQCDREEITEDNVEGHRVKMISTKTVGVGINRNIALLAATGDILLFSDDDVVYNEEYCQKVKEAFTKRPNADVIIFGLEITKNGRVTRVKKTTNRRLRLFNLLKYGTCCVAIRKNSLDRARLTFSHQFGGGTNFSSGEDSLFLIDCVKRGLKIYSDSFCLGKCAQDSSTWFTGYSDKYFYDKGIWFGNAFPKASFIFEIVYCLRIMRSAKCFEKKYFKLFFDGIDNSRLFIEYNKYIDMNNKKTGEK